MSKISAGSKNLASTIDFEKARLPEEYQIRAAKWEDLVAAVDFWNACSRSLIGRDKFTIQDAGHEWETPHFSLETDTCVVLTPTGQIVGYYEVWDLNDPHVTINIWGRVHPDYKHTEIELFLLHWAEERARQAILKAPAEARIAMQTFFLSSDGASQAIYRQAGFHLIRHSLRMVIHLNGTPPEPQWPHGVSVRSMVRGQDEYAIIQAVRDSFRDHWGYVDTPFEQEYKRWQHFMETDEGFDPSLWFLAMDDGEIAGISLCRIKVYDDPEMGWVSTLGVRRPWRRRGMGLALLQYSFSELYRRGRREIGLGVDAESLTGATRLYEKAGMAPDPSRQFSLYEKVLRPGIDFRTVEVEQARQGEG